MDKSGNNELNERLVNYGSINAEEQQAVANAPPKKAVRFYMLLVSGI